MKRYCIYHSRDLDGYTSGAIAKYKYPDIQLIGFDYGEAFPYDKISEKDSEIFMIDVSMSMLEMTKLSTRCKKLVWIDHHISAINEFKEKFASNPPFEAVLQDGIAACELAWSYFFPHLDKPESVLLLGEYDTWRNDNEVRWEKHILPFQYGMRADVSSPEHFPVSLFADRPDTLSFIDAIKRSGMAVLSYQQGLNQKNCAKNAFESTVNGLETSALIPY